MSLDNYTQLVYTYDIIIQYILWWYVLYDKNHYIPKHSKSRSFNYSNLFYPYSLGREIPQRC